MPMFFGPTQSGAAWSQGEGTPVAKRLMRHFGTVTEGRNVFIMTDGSVTENDPTDWDLVAHALWGAHVEPISDAEATLLTAAGYGAYVS